MERRTDGVVVLTQAKASGCDNHPNETVRVATSMADVEKEIDTLGHVYIKNPDTSHISNFEQQIWELDAAINVNVSGMDLATSQEVYLGRENNMQVLDVATLEQNERIYAIGPNAATQVQSSKFRP